ncbi:leucine-rich repeat-containing protein 15-like [Bradysia coprophila]|uniref:leucine-rich repeat-containing protein 15-like n=1 Tax=Bradysia coprophila TaxID=38358 RepID=UPI00187D75A9|nr:leucine-rich repeat-containing protein 15-like [Bradysia coprophila]
MNCRSFDITFVFLIIIVSVGRVVKANEIRNECSTNYLNITCTFISQYGSLFKRTPNNCYSTLELITDFSITNCNEQFLFELFRGNDRNHVIGYKNENHRDFMKRLKQIQWNHNNIQSLEPMNFSMFSDLKSIDLAFNLLNNLMSGVFDAVSSKLRVLILSHNNISHIEPMVFDKLIALEYLDLAYNNLEMLPSFRQTTLKEIHLNNNHLKSINGDFHAQFPLIISVYLMHNDLSELMLFDNGPTEIDLHDNQLSELKIVVNSTVSFLKRLHLQNNRLEKIEVIDNINEKLPCNLNYLDMTSNNVTDVAFLTKLRQLQIIHLGNNDLSQLKSDDFRRLFIALRHLGTLDLGTCRLEHSEEQFVLDGNYSGSSEIMELNDVTVPSAPSNFKCEGLKNLLDEAKNLKYLQLVLEDLNPNHHSLSQKVQNMNIGNCRDDEIQRIIRIQKDLQEKHASIFEYLKNIMASIKMDKV